MKNLISLIVAMVLCVGAYAQPKPRTSNLNEAAVGQWGIANVGLVDQSRAFDSEAGVAQVGFHNMAYIEQVGAKQKAGADLDILGSHSPCDGDEVNVNPTISCGALINLGLGFNLICDAPVSVGNVFAPLWPVTEGIAQVGAFNLASIVQKSRGPIKGRVNNRAGIAQVGLFNAAGILQLGKKNEAFATQVGIGNQSLIGQDGYKNMARALVVGKDNSTLIDQDGNFNKAVQYAIGKENMLVIDQTGNCNTAIQMVKGTANALIVEQLGCANTAIQTVNGNYNESVIYQEGACNYAVTEQGIPNRRLYSGIENPELQVENSIKYNFSAKFRPVCYSSGPCFPHLGN